MNRRFTAQIVPVAEAPPGSDVGSERKGTRVGRNVNGIFLQHFEWDDLQSPLVGRGKHDWRRHPVEMRPQPIRRGHTPPVSGNETGESILGHRRAQVVADLTLVIEKFFSDNRANRVTSDVFHACGAITIPVEAGERVGAAWVQIAAEDVLADQLGPRRVTLIRGTRTCPNHPRCRPPMPPRR